MSGFTIRPYQADDEPAVVQLWSDCGLTVPWNDPHKDIQRMLRVNPEWLLIGVLDGRPVATCMVGYDGHRGWIHYLGVVPDVRRRGYGVRIMREAERLLREVGCPKINLQVRASNASVVRFYERCGFEVDDVLSMGKRLEPDGPGPQSTRRSPGHEDSVLPSDEHES